MIAIIITLGTLLTACSSQSSTDMYKPPTVPVHAVQVKVQDVPIYFESLGTLKPAVTVEIRPQVSGMLQAFHFTEGQFVKKGASLFSVDPKPYLISLRENEAQLAQDKAALDIAQKKLNRFNSLTNKDLIPQQEWDELHSQVSKNMALVQMDEAKIASSKLDLERCEITAPINGRIGKIAIHPGNLVSASQTTPLATLSNIEILAVEFTLTEREFQQLSADHHRGSYPIEICSFTCKEANTKGALTFLDNTYDAQTGLITLQGKIMNDKHKFLPGQHVQVRIPILVTHNAMVIPQKSVKINQQGSYVFVVKEDKTVDIRHVKMGDEVGKDVIILDGLTPNEVVVTEGHLRLSPGLKVEIKTETNNL